ncbi:MAG TPA: pirin family protein, partial [Actinomycetota bacterium]|nr:pirin family protein [Actinomycetota bacterium]
MSGPVDESVMASAGRGVSAIEIQEGRTTTIGSLGIVRVLPAKGRRAIGPWCFVDLMTPGDLEEPPPIEIGPHPHIGLATVTWLFEGSALHSDSLGTEQLIRPGQLNLMTAGRGIAHAELGVDMSSAAATNGHMGVQMWLAQPEATRHGTSRFQHLGDLPVAALDGGDATVIVGGVAAASSEAVVDQPTVGLDVTFRERVEVPVDTTFEHAVVPIGDPLKVDDAIVEPGSLAYVPPGSGSLAIETRSGTSRFLLLGGEPLGVPIKMWWNFVARDLDEITEAWRAW